MVLTEIIIASGTALHLILARRSSLSFKILFTEGILILLFGLAAWALVGKLLSFLTPALFPISPLDLILAGLSISFSNLIIFIGAKFFYLKTSQYILSYLGL